MAITCPGCGREYDVTLFSFGRTLDCTCGERVGREHRLGPPPSSRDPRFLADAMLGGLARWLRILGYDTEYDADAGDEELDDFSRCARCEKVYWEGSHTRRIRRRLERILGSGG